MDAGISLLWFVPTKLLVICGIINPTHPTIPHNETDAAVIIVEHIINNNLAFLHLNLMIELPHHQMP